MRASAASLPHKLVAALAALMLTFSMAPLAWADSAPVGTAASMAAGTADDAEGADAQDAPEASAQSANAKAASSGSAGGTTVSIQVYRSSFPIVKWDLNDEDNALTDAQWAWSSRTDELPERGTPGAEAEWPEAGMPSGYAEPTRAGFEFAGWSTDKSAPAGGYIDGTDPKLAFPEGAPEGGEYTLYALWMPLEYSVMFELAKNPEIGEGPGSDASFALNWATENDVRTVADLGSGRYRVDGFTMAGADYDSATRTVKLPEPARSGYRFLGWAEPDGQGLAGDNAAKDGYAMNPVRLTQIDDTPVLTARWASAFGVTAPLSITFGDYDKTGAPGNPSMGESGSSAADDTVRNKEDELAAATDQEAYQNATQAYFENTSWHEAVKVVELASERHADASTVLTTYDSKQASEAAVLGDGTAANPGERLLSLYPSAAAPTNDKTSGAHFRLSDSLTETDLGDAFTMGAKDSGTEKLAISYGLNLSTDPVDGSDNHGLVLPTEDYERKQIATVSYTFATAEAAHLEPLITPDGSKDAFYIEVTADFLSKSGLSDTVVPGNYGLDAIKEAAEDLSKQVTVQPPAPGAADEQVDAYWETVQEQASSSRYYGLYRALVDAQAIKDGNPGPGPYFKLKVNGSFLDVQLLGICQDTLSSGGKAGFSFAFKDIYEQRRMSSLTVDGALGGWSASELRGYLNATLYGMLEAPMREAIAKPVKYQQLYLNDEQDAATGTSLQCTPGDALWVPSQYELRGRGRIANYPDEARVTASSGREAYVPFQYLALQGNTSQINSNAIRLFNGSATSFWSRSSGSTNTNAFQTSLADGNMSGGTAHYGYGCVPCFCL